VRASFRRNDSKVSATEVNRSISPSHASTPSLRNRSRIPMRALDSLNTSAGCAQFFSKARQHVRAVHVHQGRRGRVEYDELLGGTGAGADETGGECFSLGTAQLVSFQPYLYNLQKLLSQQYYLVFEEVPGKKAGFQRIKIQTELSNSEPEAPDNVWVSGAGK